MGNASQEPQVPSLGPIIQSLFSPNSIAQLCFFVMSKTTAELTNSTCLCPSHVGRRFGMWSHLMCHKLLLSLLTQCTRTWGSLIITLPPGGDPLVSMFGKESLEQPLWLIGILLWGTPLCLFKKSEAPGPAQVTGKQMRRHQKISVCDFVCDAGHLSLGI